MCLLSTLLFQPHHGNPAFSWRMTPIRNAAWGSLLTGVSTFVTHCTSTHAMLPKVTVCGWKIILAVVQSGYSFYRTCMAHGTRAHRQGAHEEQLKGETFKGLANKFGHGVTIGWDSCVVRHCTSISQSDGLSGEKVGFTRIKIH